MQHDSAQVVSVIVHNTEIDSYLRCKRKAKLTSKNGDHLTPLFGPLSLQTGSIVHRSHHLWLKDTDNKQGLEQHTMDAACEAQDRIIKSYKEKVGTEPSEDDMGTLYDSVEFCRSMARNYESYYSGLKLPIGYELIAAEQNIRVPVKGTKHYLAGRMDAFVRDRATGEVGILERKTYKQKTQLRILKRTPQLVRYAWQVSQLGISTTDKPPFILYDGLWRRHEPPKGKSIADLFTRYRFAPTKQQLAEMARYLPMILNEMAFMYEHPELAYPTVPWKGCGDCDFDKEGSELCDAMTSGNPELINYYLNNKFTERTDDTEESEDDS